MVAGCVYVVPDYKWRTKLGKSDPIEYRTWTAHTDYHYSDSAHGCNLTAFALTTSRSPIRMVIDGTEQTMDTAWTVRERVPEGVVRVWTFQFVDPVSGDVLACQEQKVSCVNEIQPTTHTERRWKGSCPVAPDPRAAKRHGPRLQVGVFPVVALYNAATGGAEIRVRWYIEGVMTEKWYCPAFEVRWPDETTSKVEQDCPPWPGEKGFDPRAWSYVRIFPPSPADGWPVEGCISKVGKKLACATARVRVYGGGD